MHTARSIADAWQLAIETVRNDGAWNTTAQLHHEIEKLLAGTIGEVMNSNDAKQLIPKSDRDLIATWCATKRSDHQPSPAPSTESRSPERSPDDARGRKRAADDEPLNSPARKERRSDDLADESSE